MKSQQSVTSCFALRHRPGTSASVDPAASPIPQVLEKHVNLWNNEDARREHLAENSRYTEGLFSV